MNQSQAIESNGSLPATLQSNGSVPALADSSNLPATYEAARQAIETCERLDECKEWENKAKALAAYARMRDDDSLRVMAVRIAERAARRYGTLFEQLYPRRDEQTRFGSPINGNAGTDNPVRTRSQAAKETGTSPRQLTTALRIAAIPEAEFNRQVESPNPPTLTQLAEQGTAKRTVVRDSSTFAPVGRPTFSNPHQALKAFAEFCESTDPVSLASTVTVEDLETVRQFVTLAERWLEQFVDNLPSASW